MADLLHWTLQRGWDVRVACLGEGGMNVTVDGGVGGGRGRTIGEVQLISVRLRREDMAGVVFGLDRWMWELNKQM